MLLLNDEGLEAQVGARGAVREVSATRAIRSMAGFAIVEEGMGLRLDLDAIKVSAGLKDGSSVRKRRINVRLSCRRGTMLTRTSTYQRRCCGDHQHAFHHTQVHAANRAIPPSREA